jgi:barstar (barnase inhibitor)
MVNLEEFLRQAASLGPCVGVHAETTEPLILPDEVEFRTLDGSDGTTIDQLFAAFAAVWSFPPRFASDNSKDSFNDWMRDLDNLTNKNLDKPQALGYLTDISNAHRLLVEEPEEFRWFAEKMPFYQAYYHSDFDPPVAFGLLLSAPATEIDDVREHWQSVGIEVATVTI